MMSQSAHQSASPARLLVVDDNKFGLSARKVVLEELGYEVEVSSSPEEALEKVQSKHFDLLITDYRMPSMSGAELIAEVRKIRPGMPIILVSGFVEAMGLNEASTGADSVIQKSSNEVGHLVRDVERLLHRPPRKGASSEVGPLRRSRRHKKA
jgi:CheY-like chemotaxis protein